MGDIRIVSASAGTGKTHKLCDLMLQSIESKQARPEAVMATTFTRKAAAELQQRVRCSLLKAGMTTAAQTLAFARIGTVNSVCGRLVSDFAFELGLSPELRVIDPEESLRLLRQAINQAMSPAQALELAELNSRFKESPKVWDEALRAIVDRARANGLDAAALVRCAEKSVESFLDLLDPPMKEGELETLALDALKDLREACLVCKLGYAEKALAKMPKMELGLKSKKGLRWSEWVGLGKLGKGKEIKEEMELLDALADDHLGHPRYRQDMRRRIELAFEVAGQALGAYEERKKGKGLIDFVDQEVLALRLLDMPRAQEQLRLDLDLVLVDEFQDTSPLQLALFLKLSKLAKTSHWVGDQKQSIFAFRDTDPALMDAAIEGILAGHEPETLDESYRSRPELVRACSALFVPAFESQGIDESRVRLEPARDEEPAGLDACIERWSSTSSKKEARAEELASQLRMILQEENVKVRSKDGRSLRDLQPGDIAVLCRSNADCREVAEALLGQGLRPSIAKDGLLSTLEGRSLLAGLRLWLDEKDSLAAAELARLFRGAGDEEVWLQEAIEAQGKPMPSPERKALLAMKAAKAGVGPLGVVDGVMASLDLREKCLAWGEAAQPMAFAFALT